MQPDNTNDPEELDTEDLLADYPEFMKFLSKMADGTSKNTYSKMIEVLETTQTLQGIECEFLTIAIQEEFDNTKRMELSQRHDKLVANLSRHINPIIIDNLFAKYLQKMKQVFDLGSWNLHGPADPREPQSPLQHMLGLFMTCIDQIPKDIDIPAGSEIVPISITVNLLAPQEAIRTDLAVVEKAILARRDELKKNRPELFMPESRKAKIKKTRPPEEEIRQINECLSILQKSIAFGKTTSELLGHKPPTKVILDHYHLQESDVLVSGVEHERYEACRVRSTNNLRKALEYLDAVKNDRFCK